MAACGGRAAPELFAPGLGAVKFILHPQGDEEVLPVPNQVGDVPAKGGIAALVGEGKFPVHPNRAGVVHRAEVEEHPFARKPLVQRAAPGVPQHRVVFVHPNPAEAALVAEGHGNLPLQGALPVPARPAALVLVVKGKCPFPIQILPNLPLKIRPWVFRPGNALCHNLSLFLFWSRPLCALAPSLVSWRALNLPPLPPHQRHRAGCAWPPWWG